jgi:hypothetical protein
MAALIEIINSRDILVGSGYIEARIHWDQTEFCWEGEACMVLQSSYQLKRNRVQTTSNSPILWQIFEHVSSVGAELLLPWMGFCEGHGTPVNRWDFVLDVSWIASKIEKQVCVDLDPSCGNCIGNSWLIHHLLTNLLLDRWIRDGNRPGRHSWSNPRK